MHSQKSIHPTRRWLAGVAAVVFFCGRAWSQVPLDNYDAVINADSANGVIPTATLTSEITLTGAAGSPFNFGAVSGDATIEFILQGDPSHNNSAFLAAGSGSPSSLRYEVWDDTGELGFTQGGVADYQFTPGVPSPKKPTHIAYVWDPTATTMKLYVNGKMAGTTTGVSADFNMPSGPGVLGANGGGEETLVATIYRVTVYDVALDAATLQHHSDALGGEVLPALNGYDASIAAEAVPPVAALTTTALLPSSGTTPFDFGATSEDATFEFILKGDPSVNESAFLAVGENSVNSLRYELWNNTGQLGFTLGGVADYQFSPGPLSPQQPTVVTYSWSATTTTMKIYVNGLWAGSYVGVDSRFVMPIGQGYLGSNPSGGERMSGIIYRVSIFDELLDEATILKHAKAFTDVLQPPIITSFTATPVEISAGGSSSLAWETTNTKKIFVDGVEHTGSSSLTVSPEVTTTYTLSAQNDVGTVQTKTTIYVSPKLDGYDAAIAADTAAGLTPAARLEAPVRLTGVGGAAFNFGAVSEDVAIEFIVEGDPYANVNGYLAVGENPKSNLRYEQWYETTQAGFTQLGVEDYFFSPLVPSSFWPTHLTYVWDSVNLVMSLYVNGTLAGTAEGITSAFGMPTGQGWLGANPAGTEAMYGTIYRVTVYDDPPSPDVIRSHAAAFLNAARPALNAYDISVDSSTAAGYTPLNRLLSPVILNGKGGVPFDFGTVSGEGTFEFILEGNPDADVSSFLAVGKNDVNSLRYEVWYDTAELGFTLGGVADYQFSPGAPAPRTATHVAYVWDPSTTTMSVYLNGVLAGVNATVDPAFELPAGVGSLGANPGGTEAMVGTIHRVTLYDDILPAEVIRSHAEAFTDAGKGPRLSVGIVNNKAVVGLRNAIPGKHYRIEYRISMLSGELWHLLQDIPSITGTTAEATDAAALAVEKQRYYRAVELQ